MLKKYKVQFELRTEGLDAPEDDLAYPEEWEVVERDAWINLTEILTVVLEADSMDDARQAVEEIYHKAFDIYVERIP